MKAVRLHEFHSQPVIDDVPEPTISGPLVTETLISNGLPSGDGFPTGDTLNR